MSTKILKRNRRSNKKNNKKAYEYIAQVYLEKKNLNSSGVKRIPASNLILILSIISLAVVVSFYLAYNKKRVCISSLSVYPDKGLFKLKYNFISSNTPSVLNIKLNNLDATPYNFLSFSVRGSSDKGYPKILKVELQNKFREKGEVYLTDIDKKWRTYHIPLKSFSNITDFSSLERISFVVEPWNTYNKRGVILIDNISFSESKYRVKMEG